MTIKLHKYKYFIPGIALVLLFSLYFPSLHFGAYVDDNALIFGNDFIKNSQNPLQYWYRGQMNTKAWPLTHTIYWLFYQCFHLHFVWYRLALILLHWVNGFCLFSFLKKKSFGAALFGASLFWVSPITVEAVTWISQIGCLLCTLFFAFWLNDFLAKKPGSAYRSNLLLIAMMITKSYAFFLAPIEIFKNTKVLGWKKSIARSVPALLFSAYSAFLVSHGVYDYPTELDHSINYFELLPPPTFIQPPPVAAPKPIGKTEKAKKIKKEKKNKAAKIAPIIPPIAAEKTTPVEQKDDYLKNQLAQNPHGIKEKLQVEGRTFSYYLLRALSFTELPVAQLKALTQWNALFLLLGIASFALFIFSLWKRYWLIAASFATYLSVSGLFYIPFMKFSLVADRVAYLPFLALAWGIAELYPHIENKFLLKAIWFWPILFFFITFFVIREPRADFPVF